MGLGITLDEGQQHVNPFKAWSGKRRGVGVEL